MSNKLTIYLAGRIGGLTKTEYDTWREVLRKKLEIAAECCNSIIQVINPADYFDFDNIEGHTDKEIMQFDLNMVRQSDIVIANINGINESIGTAIEVYEANRLNIPVIAYANVPEILEHKRNNVIFDKIHPWIKECLATNLMLHADDVVQYVKDFYMVRY